ncbi:hypothetical protein O1L60_00990 [Streptomyces diastatochromogenes]|nr:hypothetical protein [Streptomyces diastatochromogenes]
MTSPTPAPRRRPCPHRPHDRAAHDPAHQHPSPRRPPRPLDAAARRGHRRLRHEPAPDRADGRRGHDRDHDRRNGPLTLLVEWFTGDEKGSPGTPDGSETLRREGAGRYTLTLPHAVRGAGCYWGVRATTDPAAANGGSLQQVFIRRCVIT